LFVVAIFYLEPAVGSTILFTIGLGIDEMQTQSVVLCKIFRFNPAMFVIRNKVLEP
jgi:hypothetical protein